MIAPASTQFVQEDSNFLWKFGQFQVGDGNKCLTILIFDVASMLFDRKIYPQSEAKSYVSFLKKMSNSGNWGRIGQRGGGEGIGDRRRGRMRRRGRVENAGVA